MRPTSKYTELISGIFMLGVGTFYLYHAFFIKKLSKAVFNAAMFPKILGAALIVLSLVQIGAAIKKNRADAARSDGVPAVTVKPGIGTAGLARILLTLVALFFYLLGLRPAGFLIMTCLYVFAQTLILVPRGRMNIILTLILSTAFPGIVYCIFVYGFQLMLPRGILDF